MLWYTLLLIYRGFIIETIIEVSSIPRFNTGSFLVPSGRVLAWLLLLLMPTPGTWGGRFGRGILGKVRERRDREEEVCHLQWSFPHVTHWEVGGSGRTAEDVRDWVAGVRAFGALWRGLSSYAVSIVPHRWRETRAELGKSGVVGSGETPLRGRDRRRADLQQPVWRVSGDGSGDSVRVHLPEGLAVGVGLRDAIDEAGGDWWSEVRLQGVPDVAKAWDGGDGRVRGMVRSESAEEELGAEHGQMGMNREYRGFLMEMVGGSHLEGASGYAKGWVLNGLQGGDQTGAV